MPKPTIVLALDPHSAALCAVIKQQLQELKTAQSPLIQTYVLTWNGEAFGFNTELEQVADQNFDLDQIRDQQVSVSDIRIQFSQATGKLQTILIEILKAASQSEEVIAAKRQGVEISSSNRVYLMLSASNHFARGVIFELVRLMRWLFTKYFTDVPHTLEALLLLPGLFTQATTADYGAAYTFFKELDYVITGGVVVAAGQKVQPFDNCWLIDERIGGLRENLSSYADAFVGFLNVESETNGLLIGTHKVRGKIPAYSAFGYGELFFPGETVIQRLSTALAADILMQQFLPKSEFSPEGNRKLLLDAKEFILSDEFSSAFLQLERDNGKPVWQDFNPRIDIRAGMAGEYGRELRRAYSQFETREVLSYKRTLENCCKKVQVTLTAFLDSSINRHADATPQGLHETVKLLNILTYLYLELQTNSITEQPQNLITELHAAEATLDAKLQVTINNETTKNLLNQILSLKLRRQQLQATLTDDSSSEQLQELHKIQEQLEIAISEYQQALNAEIEEARQIRITAIASTRQKAEEAINQAQNYLNTIENQLEKATDKLNDLLAEESRFLFRSLVILPTFIAITFISLLILMGLFSRSTLWLSLHNLEADLVGYIIWTVGTILIYLGIVFLKYTTSIRARIQKAQKQIKRLESSLKTTAIELRRSYNEKLKLEYDIYIYNLRIETLNYLITIAKQRFETLRRTLANFSQIYDDTVALHKQAKMKFSEIRLAVLRDEELDAFYHSFLATLPTETFTKEQVKRSQSWKISAEEFQNKLTAYTRQQFKQLSHFSIGDVLKQSELIAANTATLRLNQLYDSTKLLLRLQDIDANLNPTSQREVTLWVAAKDKEQIFETYSRLRWNLTALVGEDEQRLCILTRSLGFPAYFLSQIEFYRDCYERTYIKQIDSDKDIPDLIPEEISSSREVKRAYQTLILAIALKIISQDSQGVYQFNRQNLGRNREAIALALATEFTLQEVYGEIQESLEEFEHDVVYQNLQKLATSASSLTHHERKLLDQLLSEYNPLN
jgi:hypothetical protein